LPEDEHHTEPNIRLVLLNLNGKIKGYQTAKHSIVMEGWQNKAVNVSGMVAILTIVQVGHILFA